MNRWRVAIASLVVASLAVTAGCSANDPADDGTEHIYVELLHADPVHFNPQIIADPTVERVSSNMLEALVRLSPDFEVIPWLAESWEVADDGLGLTLHLRENVTWHDGEPFDADDVVYNLTEILPMHPFGADLAATLSSVVATDAHTVELTLSQPYGPLFEALSMQFMLPEHLYAGTDVLTNPTNAAPIGTGAMMFGSFTPGEEVVLLPNPDYWGGEVQVDQAIYPIVPDANARSLAMMEGDVDLSWSLDVGQRQQFESTDFLAVANNGHIINQALTLMFNTQRPVLADPAVRALVYSAIDRAQVNALALQGIGLEPTSAISPSTEWALTPEVDYRQQFPTDVDAINAALDAAGLPVGGDGFRFTLDLRYMAPVAVLSPTAESIKSSLAEVGINVNLIAEDIPVTVDKVYVQRDFDIAVFAANVSTDPSFGITRWYTCNDEKAPHRNPSGICDEVLDATATAALHSATREERAAAFAEFQVRAMELLPAAPVAFSPVFTVINTARWDGLDDTPFLREMTDWVNLVPVG